VGGGQAGTCRTDDSDGETTMKRSIVCLLAMLWMVCATARAEEDETSKIKFADCPAAVQATLTKEAFGAKIDEVKKDVDEEDKTASYEAKVKIDNKDYVITVAEDGTLERKQLAGIGEETSVGIKLADCPTPVQTTLKREAGGAIIEEVNKETEDKKNTFSVEVKIADKTYNISVAEDGTLVSKIYIRFPAEE